MLALLAGDAPAVLSQQPPPPPRFDTELPAPAAASPATMSGQFHEQAVPMPGQAAPAYGQAAPPYGQANPWSPAMPIGPPAGAESPRRLPPAAAPSADDAAGQAALVRPGRPAAGAIAEPGGTHPVGLGPVQPPTALTPPAEPFAPGQIIAWVGNQPIQAGDIMPTIEQVLAPALAKLTPEQLAASQEQINEQKQKLLQQALGGAVETKLLYLEFLRALPADKKKDVLPNITKRAEEQFYEKQLPEALEKAQVESAMELDAALRKFGSSLAEQRRLYVERILGQSVLGQKIDYQPEVTHQEMLDYYREKAEEFARPARARWEILTVRFDKFSSTADAWAALGEMGNEVLRGAPLSAVARRHSQGANAADGGYHDWTTQGSLASAVLDQAIFSLPAARLSERLQDERGFHIVRVIEREEAGSVPFREAQVDIKEAIRKQKIRQQITEYVTKLRSEITVWTVFDEPPQTAAKPATSAGNAIWPSTYQRR